MKRQILKFSKYYNNKIQKKKQTIYKIETNKEKIVVNLTQEEGFIIDKLAEEFQCSKREVLLKGLYLLLDNYIKTKYPSLNIKTKNKRILYVLPKRLELEKEIKDYINKKEEVTIPLEFLL